MQVYDSKWSNALLQTTIWISQNNYIFHQTNIYCFLLSFMMSQYVYVITTAICIIVQLLLDISLPQYYNNPSQHTYPRSPIYYFLLVVVLLVVVLLPPAIFFLEDFSPPPVSACPLFLLFFFCFAVTLGSPPLCHPHVAENLVSSNLVRFPSRSLTTSPYATNVQHMYSTKFMNDE